MNVESDLRVASGVLTESEPDMPEFQLCGDAAYHNLYVYYYAAQLLKVSRGDIATTGALASAPKSGSVNADMVVVSTTYRKPGIPIGRTQNRNVKISRPMDMGVGDIRNLS